MEEFEWMNEYIKDVPTNKHLYKFMCKVLFRKKKGFTYKELYMILCNLGRKKHGAENSKKYAMLQILTIYKYNNNKLPENVKTNE